MASKQRVCQGGWNWLVGLSRRFMMGRKLYVGNLGYDVSSSDLQQLFSEHGTVDSADVITDRDTGQGKGFGFVEMSSDAEAQAAITALDGKDHSGRAIKVNEARPRAAGGGGNGRRWPQYPSFETKRCRPA
jgi:RNA recognition motif-containing protein